MGIFGKLFGNDNMQGEAPKAAIPWIPLTNNEQLQQLKLSSANRPQIIYKHSTTCGVSSMVLRAMENKVGASEPEADFFFLDLHRHRELSRAVAGEFRIRHESPQLLIIKDGNVVMAASHGAIAEIDFSDYL